MSARFVLDARTATHHFPGIGRYTFNLARALGPLLEQGERLILLRDPANPTPWDLGPLAEGRVEIVNVPVSPFSPKQQWVIPGLLRRLECDVYHSPYYLMPYRPSVPTVLTVHDLIPRLFPQIVSRRAAFLFRWTMALAVRTASVIIAVSQATCHDLLAFYPLPRERVSAIAEAADVRFHAQTPAQVAKVRRQYALPQGYVLYLGINKPHKNLIRLVEAWHDIAQSGKNDAETGSATDLVIAGAWDARYPECRLRAEELDLADGVRFLGFVPDEVLPALYGGATLFLYPSIYEGFGLPVLEAMACGTPVVCSDTSSLPEIVGQAALTFDPLDVEDMAAKIGAALRNRALRKEMRELGLRRAAQFSWEKAGRETLAVYRSVARQSSPAPPTGSH